MKKNIDNIYEIREINLSKQGLLEVLDLFMRGGSGMYNDSSFLEWQYSKNPIGSVVGFNAYYNDKLVSHYAAIPIKAKILGFERFGLLSINTRTDSEHQGKGLFTQLAELTYAKGKEFGFDFVVGVANQNSVHGFTKKLGFQLVGQLETRIFSTLPKKVKVETDFEIIWDKSTIDWRLANPYKNYTTLNIKNDTYIYGKSIRFRVLLDILANDIITYSLTEKKLFSNPLCMWIGIDSSIKWDRLFNIKVPQNLKKVSLNLIFKDLKENIILDPKYVKFSALDFDAY